MFNKPQIDVKPNRTDRKIIRAGWLIVILNFLIVLFFFTKLPEIIPIHFNLKGEADGFGNKSNLFGLPLINLAMYLGMTMVVKKIRPWQMNYPVKVTEKNAPELYAKSIRMLVLLNTSIALLFLLISLYSIFQAENMNVKVLFILIVTLLIIMLLAPMVSIFQMFKSPND